MEEKPDVAIRSVVESDLPAMSELNAKVFLGHRNDPAAALEWLDCLFRAQPRSLLYVAVRDITMLGYITWEMHGGFLRAEPVVELDQLAVSQEAQGQRIGPLLVRESLKSVIEVVTQRNNRVESSVSVIVWCYTLNFNAMKVYAEEFGEPAGFRTQYGDRPETMFRRRYSVVRPVK